ncbi:DUF4429 domain-containing protein [Streptomyces sp. NPDC001401]|uniref:DUF4429 domain-containing protein n=1 Tax=Streptomyces sp. NPDC001401 TaxID=3364570 RepID=UPI0036899EF3
MPSGTGQLHGDDGTLTLAGDSLELRFSVGRFGDAFKGALRIRRYPITTVADVHYEPPSSWHRGSLRLLLVPGVDPLRPLLKDPDPGPGSDPDALVISSAQAAQADAFAQMLRARLSEPKTTAAADSPCVESGVLPLQVSGSDGRVSFDGQTVALTFGRLAASEKKRLGQRDLPVGAIADVRVHHPGLTGWLRFVPAGTSEAAPSDPRTDVNTLVLNADRSQSYAVLGAAVLAAIRSTGIRLYTEQPPRTSGVPARTEPDPGLTAPAPGADTASTDAPHAPSWKERRAARRADKDYDKALAVWEREQALLDQATTAVLGAAGASTKIASGLIILKKNEAALWAGQASLVEPRRQPGYYSGGSAGVRLRIAKGVSYRIGSSSRSYIPGPEVQTPVDQGSIIVTTQRVVFKGTKASREWVFDKLLGVDNAADGTSVLLHVSNRQKVSGLLLGKSSEAFQVFLALGLAILERGPSAVADECAASAAAHREERPVRP